MKSTQYLDPMSNNDSDAPLARWLEHADWLRVLARQLVRDGGEAEDLAQEALLAASGSPVPAHVTARSWLAGIARNLARTRRRGEARQKAREQNAARAEQLSTSALDDAATIERQRDLLAHIEALPEAQRRMIIARFYDGLPVRKIAATEGVPISTVNTRVQRGLGALRKSLDGAYGDRRNWAAWAVPMSAGAAKVRWASALLLVPAVAVVVAAVMAVDLWLAPPPATDVEAVSQGEVQLASPAVGSASPNGANVAALEPEQVTQDESRVDLGAVANELEVTVMLNGAPASGVDVRVITQSELEELGGVELFYSIEATLWNHGRHLRADKDGKFSVSITSPVLAIASTKTHFGANGFEGTESSPVIDLEPCARLDVRVVNQLGTPLTAAAAEGLAVRADTRVDLPEDQTDFGSSDIDEKAEHVLIGDLASFQNRWFGGTYRGVGDQSEPFTAGPEASSKFSIEVVSVFVPGAAEYEPNAVFSKRFRPFKKRPGEQEVTLVMPPVGSIEFTMLGSDGQPETASGTLSVQFDKPPFPGARVVSYTAKIEDGKARFDRFVTGSRSFKATVQLPEEGATWNFTDAGPEREGDSRKVVVRRPRRRTITARLLSPEGLPHSDVRVGLGYGWSGGSPDTISKVIYGESDSAGNARFELPDDAKLFPPLALSIGKVVGTTYLQGATVLTMGPKELLADPELGDIEIDLPPRTKITGHVLDQDSHPLGGIDVSLRRPGLHNHVAKTDSDGGFVFDLSLGRGVTLEAQSSGGPYLPATLALGAADLNGPLEIRMRQGASVLVNVDTEGIDHDPEALSLLLYDELGKHHWFSSKGGGRYEAAALAAGSYRFDLRLTGANGPIFSLDDVQVPTVGQADDPRLSAIALRDYVREVKVILPEGERRKLQSMQVLERTGTGNKSIYRAYVNSSDTPPLLVPKRIPACASFMARDGAVCYIEDISTIEDSITLRFSEPIPRTIELHGEASSRMTYSLQGVEGTAAQGLSARFTTSLVEGSTSAEVQFPIAGTYRLFRVKKSTPTRGRGGVTSAAAMRPTTGTVEVTEDGASHLQIDAPFQAN